MILNVLASLIALCLIQPAAPVTRTDAAAARRLHDLFAEQFAWQLREFPELAMQRGDYAHADRVTDLSLAATQRRHEATVEYLKRLREIPRDALAPDDQINFDLFEWDLQGDVDGHRFRRFLMPIGGRSGLHQNIPQMAERVRFASDEDYENYLKRLEQTPQQAADTIELLKLGLAEGRTPPQVTLKGVPAQFAALLDGGLSALAEPFERFPDSISAEQRAALQKRFKDVSLPAVRGAIEKLGDFVVKEYIPKCRTGIAAIDLPDGEAFYAHQLRRMTTTDLTARQIHELGLAEVKRIRAEMMQVIRRTDFLEKFPDAAMLDDDALFKRFIEYLRTDDRFYYDTPEALLRQYRDICKRIDAELPKVFVVLPRLPYGVKPIPEFMAPSQTTAYYQRGSLDNGQPGYFMANVFALRQRPKYEMTALAIHEAVPGHHFQVALALELRDVPLFRQELWITAFGEGWALYSERLGIEMGLYADPYDDFGRLLYEMWRATRLVVDPGMHALGWNRDKAVQFMLDNTALSELNINNEIDRYIAWPGQATGYKIGELKIRELRARAEKALGPKFDLRRFHDVVLSAGSLPLGMLEKRVDAWIAAGGDRQAEAATR